MNIISEFKVHGYEIPLIMLNQSNQTQFYNELINNKISHYLCHSSDEVFILTNNLLNYITENQINRIILWNVDCKIKLILSKFLGHMIDIIDVSPGDYCFIEMDNEKTFQKSIYYSQEDYYRNIYKFVSKFDNSKQDDDYKKYLKNETVIIPNGVVINVSYQKDLNIIKKDNNFKFLVCGRITQSKHIDVILTAFSNVFKNNDNISIDLFGSVESYNIEYLNSLTNQFSELINKKIINFKGHHDNPKEIMKEYDSLIVLGTHQGSPNIILEAMSCKLPCIANDSGGTKELVNDDTGILLDAIPNVENLEHAISYTIKNYSDIIDKTNNAYNLISTKFSMENMFSNYFKVIYE
jgi:glycosyltransferase involved in cell wall biosynthesis